MDIRQLILPAGVGLAHIKVYADPGPDGVVCGGAHMHTVSSEIYYVLAGSGQLELLSVPGVQTLDLAPGQVVSFRPGVIHRLLNPNRDLQILAIMQNGGLPERGDFVLTFPPEVLNSPTAYSTALQVASHADALRRRDLASQGFTTLKQAMLANPTAGQDLLRQFYRAASKLIAPKVDGFEWVLKSGPQAELKESLDAVDFLRIGRTDYLERARFAPINPSPAPGKPGLVGELRSYALDESFLIEGTKIT